MLMQDLIEPNECLEYIMETSVASHSCLHVYLKSVHIHDVLKIRMNDFMCK